MRRLCTQLAVAFTLAVIPLSAHAAAPANVTGIKAVVQGNGVHVTWNAPASSDIAYYRIFYSHASILGNQGLYDDFEVTDATDTEHDLANLPPSDTLFVSILAVNAKGEESPGFQEEAKVEMRAQQAASSQAAATGGDKLRVLTATSLTETGVLLTFSHTVTVPREQASFAFVVRDASGAVLPLKRLIVEGSKVTLITEPQIKNRVYEVRVNAVVTGTDTAGRSLQLDTQQGPTLFSGAVTGQTTVPQPSSAGAASSVATGGEIRNLRITATKQANGMYTVELSWLPAAGTVKEYRVAQSLNSGKTYGTVQTVRGDATGVKITGVPAGLFTVNVSTVFMSGSPTKGVSQSLELPKAGGTQGSVTPTTPTTPTKPVTEGSSVKPGNLPSSGFALPFIVVVSGGISGWRFTRRKKAA